MPEERRLLVVDDEEVITWAISQALTRPGEMRVVTAHSGEEALELMAKEPFDLVVTDIRMKGMTGFELLSKIRETYPESGVIVMTAYGSPEAKREATERGSLFYLDKTFELEEFRSVVRKALEQVDRGRAAVGKGEQEGFSGLIGNLKLIDMVQLHCLARNTVTLEVHAEKVSGRVGFLDGEIVFAETNAGAKGRAAFVDILSWNSGHFENIDQAPAEQNIDESWESLLIEATALMENNTGEPDVPAPGGANSVEIETPTDIHTIVEDLIHADGILGAIVAGDTGIVVDSAFDGWDGDDNGIAELASCMARISRVRFVVEGETQRSHVIIQFDRRRVIAQEVGELGIFLLVISSGTGGLAQHLSATDAAAKKLARLL